MSQNKIPLRFSFLPSLYATATAIPRPSPPSFLLLLFPLSFPLINILLSSSPFLFLAIFNIASRFLLAIFVSLSSSSFSFTSYSSSPFSSSPYPTAVPQRCALPISMPGSILTSTLSPPPFPSTYLHPLCSLSSTSKEKILGDAFLPS